MLVYTPGHCVVHTEAQYDSEASPCTHTMQQRFRVSDAVTPHTAWDLTPNSRPQLMPSLYRRAEDKNDCVPNVTRVVVQLQPSVVASLCHVAFSLQLALDPGHV